MATKNMKFLDLATLSKSLSTTVPEETQLQLLMRLNAVSTKCNGQGAHLSFQLALEMREKIGGKSREVDPGKFGVAKSSKVLNKWRAWDALSLSQKTTDGGESYL